MSGTISWLGAVTSGNQCSHQEDKYCLAHMFVTSGQSQAGCFPLFPVFLLS